ncbi:zinc ABC transporter substrate-binding protein [Streptomyces sp. SL13]|uniref:Zinc ABC transporter substrate-binding protein n=1 Tax=Streptantibioticus silvisoli TaxID=2705255 RepID=A0AA90H0G8_9ACTN|nr:zinc ABC transporter substrate-binding protein [Streptantibioticus silvisoli]MDI5968200.1 zinc ABC transporter substrate-binding protein [Streptantibioticus silvisoli]
MPPAAVRARISRAVLPLLAVAVLGTAATACATTAPGAAGGGSGTGGTGRVIQVVAAENFWGSIAGQLGGSHVHVTSVITNPATDPHDYEPTAADARTVSMARVAVVNGIGYDTWADKLLAANPGGDRTELTVGDVVGVKPGGNPHRWYSPPDVREVVAAITADYRRADPADAAYFTARRAAFDTTALAPYDRLIADIRARWAGIPIGASESIVTPLAQGLGLKTLTPQSFLDAISEGSDPTAQDKATIDRQITKKQIKIYVYNSQNSTPDVQQQVKEAKMAGIPVATVTETLSPAGDSFQQWQVRQLRDIERALAKATGK